MKKRKIDPTQMTPDSRLGAVAAILASGVMRLRKRQRSPQKESPEHRANSLDVAPETVLTERVGETPAHINKRAGKVLRTPGRLSPEPLTTEGTHG